LINKQQKFYSLSERYNKVQRRATLLAATCWPPFNTMTNDVGWCCLKFSYNIACDIVGRYIGFVRIGLWRLS
jgi:hypothetical protein